MKKAFSLLEIIFVITIMALIASYVLKNGSNVLGKATIIKSKTEIALIRNALNINKNKRIRLKLSEYPSVLDKAKTNTQNELLFTGTNEEKLLIYPLSATTTSKKEVGMFAKISATSYYLYLINSTFVEFNYDKEEGTFSCEAKNNLCKELE